MTFHPICAIEDLPPGRRLVRRIAGREIMVLNVAGTYYAVRNRCCHQGGPVGFGPVTTTVVASEQSRWEPVPRRDDPVIRCPWHGLEFDLASGKALGDRRWRVRVYDAHASDGVVGIVLPDH